MLAADPRGTSSAHQHGENSLMDGMSDPSPSLPLISNLPLPELRNRGIESVQVIRAPKLFPYFVKVEWLVKEPLVKSY
ncbi:hypothetical protein HDU93_009763, partial [Gonapodya sp. JEL0774]